MRPLIAPRPNLNGNDLATLQRKANEIRLALINTIESIRNGSELWHGRNFQTVIDGDVKQRLAMDAWHQRLIMLDEFEKEVVAMMLDLRG